MTREEVWDLIPEDRIITEEEVETMTRLREEAEQYTKEIENGKV